MGKPPPRQAFPSGMNLIYLHCHDAGRYLSPYGATVRTPHLDRFAEGALRFDEAHCAAPTCSPSRVAMLTGLYPHQAGMLGLAHRGFSMKDEARHLVPRLHRHGYETVLGGIQHEWSFSARLPYETVLPREGPGGVADPGNDLYVAGEVARYLRQRRDTRPLFLSCGFYFPHRAFPEPEPARLPNLLTLPRGLPDVPEVRRDFAGYATAVSYMDEALGVVLAALEQTGLGKDALIVFTTDHGIAFPGMKCRLTASGTGVALLVKAPDLASPGGALRDLVSQIDLYPTFGDYAGLEPVAGEGRSLRPLLRGESRLPASEVYSEVTYHAAYEPMRAVRTVDHLYIRRFDLAHHPALANIDRGPAKVWMHASGHLGAALPEEELYDLRADPEETGNLAQEPAQAALLNDCRSRLLAWMERTDDPLRLGPVAAPAGAFVTPPAALHAS